MKIKNHLWLIFLMISQIAFAQEGLFQWAVGAQNMSFYFQDFVILSDNSVVAIAKAEEVNYTSGESVFRQGNGEVFDLDDLYNEDASIIMKLSPQGLVAWYEVILERSGALYQIEKNENDEIILLAEVIGTEMYTPDDYDKEEYEEYGEEGESDREEEYVEEEEENEEEAIYLGNLRSLGLYGVPAGTHIIHLGADGSLRQDIHAELLDDLNLEDGIFLSYLEGKYLFASTGGGKALAQRLQLHHPGTGDEYVLALSAAGELLWGDMLFYRDAWGYLVGGRDLCFAPDGTVYRGGTYEKGATFSNGLQTLTPTSYKDALKGSEKFEGYLISYSPQGEINWLKREGCASFLGTLAATNAGIYVGHRTLGNKLMEQIVDTTEGKTYGISFIDRDGNVQWNLMTAIEKAEDMQIDDSGNLLMLGALGLRYRHQPYVIQIGEYQLPKEHTTFIASLNSQGKALSLQSFKLHLPSSNTPTLMRADKADACYIAGQMWMGFALDIQRIEQSLPPLNGSGGIPILGKIRK